MDPSRNFNSVDEALSYAEGQGYSVDSSVDGENHYAYKNGVCRYSLETSTEGLFYWETY